MNATKPGKPVVRSVAPAANPFGRPRSRTEPASHGMPGQAASLFQATVRSLIALLLIWAGLSKLGDPVTTYTAMLAYQLPLPGILWKLVALALPWLELLCGLMLLANFHRRLATLVTSVLFSVFLVMVGQAFVRGLDISCGCFNLRILGIEEASAAARFFESVGFALVRNLLLLAGGLYLLRTDKRLAS